jgi:hypothetical protein
VLAYIFYCLHDIFCFRNTVDADPRWCCTYLLGPSDALFIEVGQAFIKQQIKGMYLSFVSLQHMKLDFVPKFLNQIKGIYRYSFFLLSFWMYAEYGDVTNIYNWYVRLICFFGISPECMCDCSVSFACWVTRFCYQLLLVGMVYLSLLTNEF